MEKVIVETINGMRQITAEYNSNFNSVRFEENTMLHDGRKFNISRMTLSKEDLHLMLKYFYDMEDKGGEQPMIDYKVVFSVPHDFEGFNGFVTAQGNIDSIVITTNDGQTVVLNDVESFEIVEAVKVDIDEDQKLI